MGLLTKLLLVLLVIGGGGFVWLRMQVDTPQAGSPVIAIRVASETLPIGVFLSDTIAPFTDMPRDTVTDSHIRRGDDVPIGAVIIAQVAEGKPITRHALLLPGQEGFLAAVLKPGMRAVSLAVDAVTSNAGHIFPGDRVDILLTQHLEGEAVGNDPWRTWAAETILNDVRVIAVDQNLHSDLTMREQTDVARTITLEVRPHDAERLAVARNLGALSLTLRSLILQDGDTGQYPDVAGAEPPPPTWSGDISAASRAAAKRPEAKEPEPTEAPIRFFRGSQQEEVAGQ